MLTGDSPAFDPPQLLKEITFSAAFWCVQAWLLEKLLDKQRLACKLENSEHLQKVLEEVCKICTARTPTTRAQRASLPCAGSRATFRGTGGIGKSKMTLPSSPRTDVKELISESRTSALQHLEQLPLDLGQRCDIARANAALPQGLALVERFHRRLGHGGTCAAGRALVQALAKLEAPQSQMSTSSAGSPLGLEKARAGRELLVALNL